MLLIFEAVVAVWMQRPWLLVDSAHYLDLARNLSGPGFVSAAAGTLMPEALRSPGYPLFLNLLLYRLGWPIAAVIALQMLLYLASVWLVAHVVIHRASLRATFLLLAAGYVFPMLYSALLLSEALAIFLVTCIAAALSAWPRHTLGALAAGTAAGLATLVRGDLLLTLFAVICVLVYRHSRHVRTGLGQAAVATVAALTVMSPYMAWNHETFGSWRPIPIASALGQSLYLSTWESSLDLKDRQPIVGGPPTQMSVNSGLVAELSGIAKTSAASASAVRVARNYPARQHEIASGQAFLHAAIDRIEKHPADALMHSFNATWRLLNTGDYPGVPFWIAILLKAISFGAFALGVAGAFIALFWPGIVSRAPLALWVAVQGPHLPLHTEARYTAAIRLFLLLYAAVAVTTLLEKLRNSPRLTRSADHPGSQGTAGA